MFGAYAGARTGTSLTFVSEAAGQINDEMAVYVAESELIAFELAADGFQGLAPLQTRGGRSKRPTRFYQRPGAGGR